MSGTYDNCGKKLKSYRVHMVYNGYSYEYWLEVIPSRISEHLTKGEQEKCD